MKKILLLATGGTIASRPTAAGGLAPAITSEELLACVPIASHDQGEVRLANGEALAFGELPYSLA